MAPIPFCLAAGLLVASTMVGVSAARAEEMADSPEPEQAPDWSGTLEIYGFTPLRTTGTTTINGFESDVDLDLGDILSALDWATFVRGSVERGRWGLLTDLSYVKLGAQNGRTTPRGRITAKTDISSTQGIYDLAVRYRFGDPESAVAKPGSFSLIPYMGVRVIDVGLDVRAQLQSNGPEQIVLGAERSFDRTWAQPLAGIQGTYFLSPKLRAFARADIGGFDFSGAKNVSGNAQIGLGYAVGNNTDLTLSWRYLGLQYGNGNTPASGFTSYQNGIEAGVKFFF
ncbi:outer membrane protein [Cyanobium sp. NS01]|nr:outer membrane protein [Cyanobium sp. NS01]